MDITPGHILEMKKMGNRDGVGVMWCEEGRVKTERILSPTDQELTEIYGRHIDKDMAIHLRNQSAGTVQLDNVHPFVVTSKDMGHPEDIMMMHNGTFYNIQVESDKADSYNLATYFLRPILAENPKLIRNKSFINFLSAMIGNSKLVFLTSKREFIVVNSELGRVHETGAWISTKSDIDPKASAPSLVPVPATTKALGNTGDSSGSKKGKTKPVITNMPLAFFRMEDHRLHFQYKDPFDSLNKCPTWLEGLSKEEAVALAAASPEATAFIMDFKPELIH